MTRAVRIFLWCIATLALLGAAAFFARAPLMRLAFAPTASTTAPGVGLADLDDVSPDGVVLDDTATDAPTAPSDAASPPPAIPARPAVETIADGLRIPWEVVALPDGGFLLTERAGMLVRLPPPARAGEDAAAQQRVAYPVPGVRHVGEGGLLGMALHPAFAKNDWVYLYLTGADAGGALENRVERYRLAEDGLHERRVILGGIPGARNHDGGRLAFGPDGMLYVTVGDASNSANAQSTAGLAGKILRITPEGDIPDGNPFGNATWSYGHRNPQGIAFDAAGRLWATEHGRSGAATGYDELNHIEPGANYGWPTIQGPQTRPGMVAPVLQSGASETWAPSGMTVLGDTVFFAGLRGASLYAARINADGSVGPLTAHFRGDFGRLRTVAAGPDGMLYVLTSNTDGRGQVRVGDDRLLRIDPTALFAQP